MTQREIADAHSTLKTIVDPFARNPIPSKLANHSAKLVQRRLTSGRIRKDSLRRVPFFGSIATVPLDLHDSQRALTKMVIQCNQTN